MPQAQPPQPAQPAQQPNQILAAITRLMGRAPVEAPQQAPQQALQQVAGNQAVQPPLFAGFQQQDVVPPNLFAPNPQQNAQENARNQAVQQAVQHIRDNHECRHESFGTYREYGEMLECEVCNQSFPTWLRQCKRCLTLMCTRCKNNRL